MKQQIKQSSVKILPTKRLWKRLIAGLRWTAYIIISLYFIIWLISPTVARYYLSDFVKQEYQLTLSEDANLRYNPFTSHFTVRNLALYSQDAQLPAQEPKRVFELDKLDFEFRLHRLLMDELYISQFNIDGLFIAISQLEDKTLIAGLDLAQFATVESDNQEITKPSETIVNQPDQQISAYMMVLPVASFNGMKFEIELSSGQHTFVINQWTFNNLWVSEQQQKLATRITAEINSAPLLVSMQTNLEKGAGELDLQLSLVELELVTLKGELASQFTEIEGKLSLNSSYSFEVNGQGLKSVSPSTQLKLVNVNLANEQLQLSLTEQILSVSEINSEITFTDDGMIFNQPLTVESVNLDVKNIKASFDGNQFVSESQQVAIGSLKIEQMDNQEFQTNIELFEFTPGKFQFENDQQVLSSSGLKVTANSLTANQHSQSIDQIIVDGLDAIFTLKPVEKAKQADQVKPTSNIAESKNQKTLNQIPSGSDPKQQTENLKNTVFKLNSMQLVNSEAIQFNDETAKPKYSRSILFEDVKLSSIDSSQPNQASPFNITGKSEQYTLFDLKGYIKPFTSSLNLHVEGSLKEFSLPTVSSYIQELLGFEIESGELDTLINIDIVDAKIKGKTGINIRGLALAKAENYDQSAIKAQTAMPLNVALGMLKDSDDNVELDIPMLGNVDNPTFGIGSFVSLITKKAIQSAATSYLIKTFIPYSEVINMTITAGEFILKTRFEDLNYEAAQVEVSEQQSEYLKQFIALMKNKKSTQVKICGIATIEDYQPQEDQKEEQNSINLKLREIANQRMDAFKNTVVEQGVESSRLLLCSPKIDLTPGKKPRLVISV